MVTRNVQLDVLRGIAVLLVIGRHCAPHPTPYRLSPIADAWYQVGWLGVDLFFVLSGFLVSGLLFSEYDRCQRVSIGRFLIRRGWKIYPPYLVLVTYMIIRGVMKTDPSISIVEAITTQWDRFALNFVFLQNYGSLVDHPAAIPHSWTLAVEEHFYLMLPLLIYALVRLKRLRMILVVSALAIPACLLLRIMTLCAWPEKPAFAMAATHNRLDALLMGVGLRACVMFYPGFTLICCRLRFVLVLGGALFWAPALILDDLSPVMLTGGLTLSLIGAGAILTGTLHITRRDCKWCEILFVPVVKVLTSIGVYSYSIYLWHVTITRISERELVERVTGVIGNADSDWLLGRMIVVLSTVVGGIVLAWIVERPSLFLRDRLWPSQSGALGGVSSPVTAYSAEQHSQYGTRDAGAVSSELLPVGASQDRGVGGSRE